MSAEVAIGGGNGARLVAHPLRAAVLGEVHARPFTPIETPRGCCISPSKRPARPDASDRAALADFCARRGLDPLKAGAKQHRVALGGAALRWEQHSEFTTYTWELPAESAAPFHPAAVALATPMASLPQPGPLHRGARSPPHRGQQEKEDRRRTAVRPRQPRRGGESRRATRCSPPTSSPTRPVSCASWCSTGAWGPSAPARWCSGSSRSRPIARSLCSACPRRSASRHRSTASRAGSPR